MPVVATHYSRLSLRHILTARSICFDDLTATLIGTLNKQILTGFAIGEIGWNK